MPSGERVARVSVIKSSLGVDLTVPQKAALKKFEFGVKRAAFPDINPRTAQALWSKGLIRGETVSGSRLFNLTDLGLRVQQDLSD